MHLDVDYARSCFPALGSGWGFFDNAGGSQTLGEVGKRIQEYLYGSMAAQGGPYPHSELGKVRLDAAGRRFTTFVNAADPGEIIMGSSTTQLLQHLAQSMATTLTPGDRVVISQAEHQSNIDPWERLVDHGIDIVRWNVNPDSWLLETADLAKLVNDRTRLVAFTHCSNILGSLHDVGAMTRWIHERGAQVLVDGVAYAPHDGIDVQAWDVDYYVFSTYKTYGPHHAVLYGKRRHLLELPPVNFRVIAPDVIPYKFQPGNANPELSHGATAVVDYLEELALHSGAKTATNGAPASRLDGATSDTSASRQRLANSWAAIRAHEAQLSARFMQWAVAQSNLRILGLTSADRSRRVPTISFTVKGVDSQDIARHLAQHQLGIRAGTFYALALGEAFDFARHNGVVRVSMVHTNTLEEVDRLTKHLDEVVGVNPIAC
jgi:cysteine desulfurase family protein (TIGR01976 family)